MSEHRPVIKGLTADAQLLLKHNKDLYEKSLKEHRRHSFLVIAVLSLMIVGLLSVFYGRWHKWEVQKDALITQHQEETQAIIDTAFYIKDNLIAEYYVDDKKRFENFMLIGAKKITSKYQEHAANIKKKKFSPMTDKEMKSYLEVSYAGGNLAGIDPFLLLAMDSVESEYNKKAKSSVGARGICQFMPLTAKLISRAHTNFSLLQVDGYDINKLYDPVYSKKLQIRFLKHLFDEFDGRVEWVLLAYNWGPSITKREWWQNGEALFSDLDSNQREFAENVLNTYNRLKSTGNGDR